MTKWMIDSGCGYDIISQQEAQQYLPDAAIRGSPITFKTANGNISTRSQIAVQVDEFQQRAEPFVLPDSPPLLSLGRRCKRDGFTFVWQAYQKPYFIRPDCMIIQLDVEGDIPLD